MSGSEDNNSRVAAVVVTHNRIDLLKECVAALRTQSRKIDEIIIVNNGSTDGTGAWLEDQRDLTVFTQDNLGSSGGQNRGIREAYQRGFGWFWCMDDDTIAHQDAHEEIQKTGGLSFGSEIGFISTRVLWIDGKPSKFNITYENGGEPYGSPLRRVWASTFVGVFISRRAVEKVGLPIKELFLWGDDYEYSMRIAALFPCYLADFAKVIHKTKEDKTFLEYWYDRSPNMKAKHKYAMRNSVYLAKREARSPLKKLYIVTRKILGAIYYGFILRKRSPCLVLDAISGAFFNPAIEYVRQEGGKV